jgi:hypothetical protein
VLETCRTRTSAVIVKKSRGKTEMFQACSDRVLNPGTGGYTMAPAPGPNAMGTGESDAATYLFVQV